jgi:glycosyltransferase involved in cell wall biosynthesis
VTIVDRRRSSVQTQGGHRGGRLAVALYTDSIEPSGVGVHMLELARELHPSADVTFLLNDAPRSRALADAACRYGFHAATLSHDESFPAAFRAALDDIRPGILHVHAGIGWEGLRAPRIAHEGGVPAIVRTEHLPYLIGKPEEHAAYCGHLHLLDAIIAVSGSVAQTYRDAGVPDSLIHVVRNGHAPRLALRGRLETRAALELEEEDRAIVTVARLAEQKGHRVLIEAAPEVIEAHPRTRFLIVGGGPLAGELAARIQANGLQDHVRLLGERGDVPELLAASDLFVLPSFFEGLPLSLLEAYAAGLPIVACRAPGTVEAVIDDETALMVPPGDAAELSAAITRVLSDPALAARLGEAGRRHAARNFTAERMGRETLAVYRAALAASSGAGRAAAPGGLAEVRPGR